MPKPKTARIYLSSMYGFLESFGFWNVEVFFATYVPGATIERSSTFYIAM